MNAEGSSELKRSTFALRLRVESQIEDAQRNVRKNFERARTHFGATGNNHSNHIRILHISDLHFNDKTKIEVVLQPLIKDLQGKLNVSSLNYIVLSGDMTDKGSKDGLAKAKDFILVLATKFGVSANRCIFVPGNHDQVDSVDSYGWRQDSVGLEKGSWVQQGDIVLARNESSYHKRFAVFSDIFFHPIVQKPYPLNPIEQGIAYLFPDDRIQFLTMNSSWEVDQFFRKRSSIDAQSLARLLETATAQHNAAIGRGEMEVDGPLLQIGVWHHAVTGPNSMQDLTFLDNLRRAGVKLGLHGDVHELRRDLISHWSSERLYVVGGGSFGSAEGGLAEGATRLYNLIDINRDLSTARVHTRQQKKDGGVWDGLFEWEIPNSNSDVRVSSYDIPLT